jgi:hypothetical protein
MKSIIFSLTYEPIGSNLILSGIIIFIFSLSITATALPQAIAQRDILSTASLSSHNSTGTNDDFLTYSNFAYGIKIKYPSGWEQRENTGDSIHFPDDLVVVFYSPTEQYLINYPAELKISVSHSSLSSQYLHAIDDIKADSNLKLIGSYNTTIANYPAYKLVYEQSVDTGRNISIQEVTKFFVEGKNTLYTITYVIQESSRHYTEYIKIGQKIIDSFEISFARTFNPPLTIDGKLENGEWNNIYSKVPGIFRIPESFSLTLINRTELLPTNYNITLLGIGDDKNMYLLIKIKGPSTSKAGTIITLWFDPGAHQINDMLRIYPTSKYTNGKNFFEDGFLNNTAIRFQDDIKYEGTRDGFAGISFSNETEIVEVSHPLCSGDKNDICLSPDTAVGFSFMLNTTDDSAIWNPSAELSFSSAYGLYYQDRFGAPPGSLIPPVFFILDTFKRFDTPTEHQIYLKVLDQEEIDNFLKVPTKQPLMKILRGVSHDDLLKLLRAFSADELKDLSKVLTEHERVEILNRLTPSERTEISNNLSPSN